MTLEAAVGATVVVLGAIIIAALCQHPDPKDYRDPRNWF